MKHTLILLLCLVAAGLQAQDLSGRGPVRVWKATVTPGKYARVRQASDQPFAVFPPGTPVDSLQHRLPDGVYVVQTIAGRYSNKICVQVSPLRKVEMTACYPEIRLKLEMERFAPGQVSLFEGSKKVPYDSVSGEFVLGAGFHRKADVWLKAVWPGGESWLKLNSGVYAHREWVHTEYLELIDRRQKRQLYWKQLYYGYAMFSQPIYKPGDTARFKVFVVDKRGRPLRDSLTVVLSQNSGFRKELRLMPARPGAYTGELVLGEASGVKVDTDLQLRVFHRLLPVDIWQNAAIEAYKLKEIVWHVENRYEWQPDTSFEIAVSTLDANKRPVPDAQMTVTVLLDQITSLPDSIAPMYVPDTLFTYKGAVKSLLLPDSLHPGVGATWKILVEGTSGANERYAYTTGVNSVWKARLAPVALSLRDDASFTRLADSSRLKLPPSALVVTYEMPEQATPGAAVDMRIRVTDRDGKPVAGADVLAVGVNSMMDQMGFAPPLPPLQAPEPVEVERYGARIKPLDFPRSLEYAHHMDQKEQIALGLDSLAWYRLTAPDSIVRIDLPLSVPGNPQVAPFFFCEGEEEPVEMIWIADPASPFNRQLIYHAWLKEPYCPEVPVLDSLLLFVRTPKALYSLPLRTPAQNTRLVLSFNPRHLPANVTREKRPDHLLPQEAEELNRTNVVVSSTLPGQCWLYPKERWEDGKLLTSGGTTILFTQGEVTAEVPGKWRRSFQSARQGIYTLEEEVLQYDNHPYFTAGMHFSPQQHVFAAAPLPVPNRAAMIRAANRMAARQSRRLISVFDQRGQYGAYYAGRKVIALMKPGDTLNLWPIGREVFRESLQLPVGNWVLVLMDGQQQLALHPVTIRARHTLVETVPDSLFHPHQELWDRLAVHFKVASGKFVNDQLSAGTDTIKGTVFAGTSPVAGATVLLLSGHLQIAGTFTNAAGEYAFPGVYINEYHVVVVKDGFLPADVSAKNLIRIPLTPMAPQPGGLFQAFPFEYRDAKSPGLYFRDLSVCGESMPAVTRFWSIAESKSDCLSTYGQDDWRWMGKSARPEDAVESLAYDTYTYGHTAILEEVAVVSDRKLPRFLNASQATSAWFDNPLENVYKRVDGQSQEIARMDDDTDGDGIPDLLDREPNTRYGVLVDANGVTLTGEAAFEALQLRTRFADCAWWQPLLTTDSLGMAHFRTRLPEDITAWNGYALVMTGQRQAGQGRGTIRAQKTVEARLSVPDFLTAADTVQAIGRVTNYSGDSLGVTLRYGQVGLPLLMTKDSLRNSLKRTFPLIPAPRDTSLLAEFSVALPGGTADGEQRRIPLFPVGVKEAQGTLLMLYGDTSLVFSPGTQGLNGHLDTAAPDSALLSLSSDQLFPLLREVEALRIYPYGCNEQASSKLAGLLAARAIANAQGKAWQEEAEIRRLVKKLSDGQNPSGLWGWFPRMSDNVWLSALILRRIYAADTTASCIGKAQTALRLRVQADTTLPAPVRVAILTALAETHAVLDYHAEIARVKIDYASSNAVAALGVLKTKLHQPVDQEAALLLSRATPTILGGLFWDAWGWNWYGDGWETTLLAYEVLKHAGDPGGRKRAQVRQGLLEQTSLRRMNTLQSATLLATVLPDLISGPSGLISPVITVEGEGKSLIVRDFPFQMRVKAGEPLSIRKSGISPVYLSYDLERWNPAPVPLDSLFAVSTRLERDGKTVTALHPGDRAELVVTLTPRYAGTHLALDVPIPAGCTYAAKPQYYQPHDCHRAYDYHQITIFIEAVNTGSYTYRIPLEARFGGRFVLNPARIHMMYMPHKQGFNEVRRVEVR